MTVEKSIVIELTPSISARNELQLTFRDVADKEILWQPGNGVEPLFWLPDDIASLTVEVNDFYQFGSLYTVYGALLTEKDMVAAYWEATGRGQRQTLARPSTTVPAPRLLIGAAPRMPGAPVPAAFHSWVPGGGLPTDDATTHGE
jgi:hypothetical protein